MDILELAEIRSVKELKTYLDLHSIEYSKKYGCVSFETVLADVPFDADAHTGVNGFTIVLQAGTDACGYEKLADKILEIKDRLISVLGQPTLDSTNHLNRNDISVQFTKERIDCSLCCTNDRDYDYQRAMIILSDSSAASESGKKGGKRSVLNRSVGLVLISLIGGFFWGLAMFGFMELAFHDFSLSSFGLWMLGGFIFGVLFALAIGGTAFTGKSLAKKNYGSLYKKFELKKGPEVFPGNTVCRYYDKKGKPRSYDRPTLLQIADSGVILHFLNKSRKPFSQRIPLADACKESLFGLIGFETENEKYQFVIGEPSLGKRLEDELFSRVIDRRQFDSLFECFKTVVRGYDPYSIYCMNASDVLDAEIGRITGAFLISGRMTEARLLRLIRDTFSYNDFTTEALAGLLREAYTEWKNG